MDVTRDACAAFDLRVALATKPSRAEGVWTRKSHASRGRRPLSRVCARWRSHVARDGARACELAFLAAARVQDRRPAFSGREPKEASRSQGALQTTGSNGLAVRQWGP